MMKYTKNNSESGVALIFAIGLLALLLLIGLAFVGNSINYRKVAENNSSRSQARMFALSAVSRAANSLQIFSHQFIKYDDSHEPPKSFNHVFSFARYNDEGAVLSGGAYEYNDGLVGDYSLLLLPENSSVLSSRQALSFNNPLRSKAWPGRWVFFTNGQSGADRRIIGRAAWQVVGSPAEILAPVFMRGGVTVDPWYSESGAPTFTPNKHRWGREIDEVVLPTDVFSGVDSKIENADSKMATMDDIYGALGISGSGDAQARIQRWAESWFIPDFSGGTVGDPGATSFTETYTVGRYSRLRFNISELNDGGSKWMENRDEDTVYEGLDQWYARLGITAAADANGETAIERLTADSLYFMDHSGKLYDYEIFGIDREFGGLPFLRRIGDTAGTFGNLANLRKQIAANFNDYCDSDSIPTSDVAATGWKDLLGTDGTDPTYTGNELTPYLYEIGMVFGIVSQEETPGIVSASRNGVSGEVSFTIPKAEMLAAPIVKLCNIYPYETGAGESLYAYIDVGKLSASFKLKQITLKNVEIKYTDTDDTSKTETFDITLDSTFSGFPSSYTGTFGADTVTNTSGTRAFDVKDNPLKFDVDNSGGSNPYPSLKTSEKAQSATVPEIAGTFTLSNLTIANLKGTGVSFSAGKGGVSWNDIQSKSPDVSAQPSDITIDKIEVTGVTCQIRRAVLTVGSDTGQVGIDFVRELPEQSVNLTWEITLPLPASNATEVPGVVFGSFRNYDPRQNLNAGDWLKLDKAAYVDNIFAVPDDIKADGTQLLCLAGVNSATGDNGFDPSVSASDRDTETAAGPAYSNTNRISTAVIRNAPMMSPWEIGFIHRGIRWQTINIKKAGFTNFADNEDNWNNPGSKYEDGDGAILEQIKMSDRIRSYGKININRLQANDPHFAENETQVKAIAQAVFRGVEYNENPLDFIEDSTRDANGWFDAAEPPGEHGGIVAGNWIDTFTAGRDSYHRRIEFLQNVSAYGNAFGAVAVASQTDDAAQEEIIGKTINLLSATTSDPKMVYVVVIAQSIRDRAGEQVQLVTETDPAEFTHPYSGSVDIADGVVTMECQYGRFDYLRHKSEDPGKHVYFDEITGEVKMFVQLFHDSATGKLTIQKIDYL